VKFNVFLILFLIVLIFSVCQIQSQNSTNQTSQTVPSSTSVPVTKITKTTKQQTTLKTTPSPIHIGSRPPTFPSNLTKISPEDLAQIEEICKNGNCLNQTEESLQRRTIVKKIYLQMLKWRPTTNKFSSLQSDKTAENLMKLIFTTKKAILRSFGLSKSLVQPADDGLISGNVLLNEVAAGHILAKTLASSPGLTAERDPRAVFGDKTYKPFTWKSPIEYFITENISESSVQLIHLAVAEISSKVPCLKFVEKKGKIPEGEYQNILMFSPLPSDSPDSMCLLSSVIRMVPYPNAIFVNEKCQNMKSWLLHGILQVLGVTHQFNRLDRNDFLSVNWENIKPELFDVFVMDNKDISSSYGIPFDYESVHFFPSNFGAKTSHLNSVTVKNSTFETSKLGMNQNLSCGDIEVLKKMLCCTPTCQDAQSLCGYYADVGYCTSKSHWFWMTSNCKKSCDICCPSTNCKKL